eukprot:8815952-Pyramimonas_sp.AAC.1
MGLGSQRRRVRERPGGDALAGHAGSRALTTACRGRRPPGRRPVRWPRRGVRPVAAGAGACLAPPLQPVDSRPRSLELFAGAKGFSFSLRRRGWKTETFEIRDA